MKKNPLEHEWITRPLARFPNGEIFLITAIVEKKKIHRGLPAFLLDDFRSRVASLSLEELFDPNIQERLRSWLDEAVGFSLPVVRWRTAAEYRYDGGPIVIPEGDPAVWNKDYTPDESINSQNS